MDFAITLVGVLFSLVQYKHTDGRRVGIFHQKHGIETHKHKSVQRPLTVIQLRFD